MRAVGTRRRRGGCTARRISLRAQAGEETAAASQRLVVEPMTTTWRSARRDACSARVPSLSKDGPRTPAVLRQAQHEVGACDVIGACDMTRPAAGRTSRSWAELTPPGAAGYIGSLASWWLK